MADRRIKLQRDRHEARPAGARRQRIGNVFQDERGEVASWLVFMAGLAAATVLAVAILTLIIANLANDVASAAETGLGLPQGPDPAPRTTGPGTGNPGDAGDSDAGDPLPISTSHCSFTVTASGDALGIGVGLGTVVEVIVQEMPDGTTIVTIAGEVGANSGTGTSVGAGVTVNDSTAGAYAAASADVWGSLGGGAQYELAPGETVADLLVGIGVSASPAGLVSSGINTIFPGSIPQAPPPDTLFVDGSTWGSAGGTAQAGVGLVSAGANIEAEVKVNQAYAIHSDGTYSATTTYSGSVSGDAGVTGGIPVVAWGSVGVAGEASGSVSVQTIYDEDFNAVEMIVTTTYGHDADAIVGSDDDNPTVTTQQWTLDLSDPEVNDAVMSLDGLTPAGSPLPQAPTQNPADAWSVIADNAATAGPLTQQLSTTKVDIAVEAGAIAAGVSGGINGNCTELS